MTARRPRPKPPAPGPREFRAALERLDARPPTLGRDAEREEIFLRIGGFFEQNIREGGPWDLKRDGAVWEIVERRLQRAVEDARRADRQSGRIVAWQLYNDGVVLRAGGVTIGLDVVVMPRAFGWPEPPGLADELADLLDVLFVTHGHEDHFDPSLVRCCLRRGKPVLLPGPLARDVGPGPNLHAVSNDWRIDLRGLEIVAREGCHVWRETAAELPLAYFEIACPGGFRFIFGGDVDYTRGFESTPGRRIDLLFLPWRSPNERFEDGHEAQIGTTLDAARIALERVAPAALMYEHLAEFEHVYNGFPASYDIAVNLKRRLPVPSELLFWGEKIALR